MSNDGYTKIKNILITSSKLDDTEFRILTYLISISKNRMSYPSIRKMAESIHSSDTTIKRKLQQLQEKGFILKENRVLGAGKKTSNVYLINEDVILKPKKKDDQLESEELKFKSEKIQTISDYDWIYEE